MKKILIFIFLLLTFYSASSQTTSVTFTVTDSTSQLWTNGSWNIKFVPNPNYPNITSYRIGGSPLSSSVINQSGSLNSSAVGGVTVYQSGAISPSGSGWALNICPNATSLCGNYSFTTASNSSLDVSSALTSVIPIPSFSSIAGSYGYNDNEAKLTLPQGGTYWNVVNLCQRYNNGSGWACYNGVPSGAGIGSCPSNQYEITDTISGPTCAQVAYSQISGAPSSPSGTGSCPSGQYEITDTLTGPTCAQVNYSQIGGTPPSGGITQLTGDGTAGPGSGSQALILATVNSSPGTCGDATHVCQTTTNGKGLTTAQSAVSITYTLPSSPTTIPGVWVPQTCNSNGCYEIINGTIHEWGISPTQTGTGAFDTVTVTLPLALADITNVSVVTTPNTCTTTCGSTVHGVTTHAINLGTTQFQVYFDAGGQNFTGVTAAYWQLTH